MFPCFNLGFLSFDKFSRVYFCIPYYMFFFKLMFIGLLFARLVTRNSF